MGNFTTQFEMKNMLTHVTVHGIGNHTFGCIINPSDISSPTESPDAVLDYDIIIKRTMPGKWETVGEPKISLNQHDLFSLGNAIEGDKTVQVFDPDNY